MTDEHCKRLVRELVLPDEVDLVIQKPKYWTPTFCWLYFDRCDQLIADIPAHGLVAAEICPELVYLTRTVTREPQDRLELRALAVLGSGYRATDDLDQAEATYKQAFELIRTSKEILQSDAANVLFRFSYVLAFRQQYEKALQIASQSIGIYRVAPDEVKRRDLGAALTARGYIHHMFGHLPLAMKDWGEAVACTEVKLTPRVFFAVVHNLAFGMTESVVPAGDLSTIERYLSQASRYFSSRPLSVPKMKVLWVRAMVQYRFGSTRRGEASYRKAIAGFLKLGEIVDVALASVSFGRHLHREGRYDELKHLALETHEIVERLCPLEDIKSAILIWKETVCAKTVSAEVFATTWRLLERASFSNASRQQPDTLASGSKIVSVRSGGSVT